MNGRRRLLIADAAAPYKRRLQYIRSSGEQYINTGVNPTSDLFFSVDVESPVFGTQVNCFVCGARLGTSRKENYGLVNYSLTSSLRFDRGNINLSPNFKVYSNVRCTIARDGADNYVDGVLVNTCTTEYDNPGIPIYLFAMNQNDTVFHGTNDSLTLYSCEIKVGGVEVRSFIPVLDFNDVPCLYDKISGNFFYNAGTGNFSYA